MSTTASNPKASVAYSTPHAHKSSGGVVRNAAELTGRALLVTLFLLSGIGKITAYGATAGYMASAGVPGALLPLVIVMEISGSLAIVLGWQTRLVAVLLAGFTLLAGVLFHNNFGDQTQMIMFLKNLSITGAFLMLAANGAGAWSLDALKSK